jgi:hypothetical protein
MRDAAQVLLAEVTPSAHTADFLPFVQTILTNEPGFLSGMNLIVSQYQQESEDRLTRLQQTEIALVGLLLLSLMLDGIFVIFPALQRLRLTINDLARANERAAKAELTRKKAERIIALNEALAAGRQTNSNVSIVALGHYHVRDCEGSSCNVYHRENGGQQFFECECPQYQQQVICSHSLAAAALHNASGFQVD